MMPIDWTIGVEIELLAPAGVSRRDLAEASAADISGRARPIFYPQAEFSAVANKPVFETLTLGWEVIDANGISAGRFVDDLTLQDDLDRSAAPKAGWYRILGDELRIMRLIGRHAEADASLEDVLEPARALFAGTISVNDHGFHKLLDSAGATVAIAAPLPGERERACEIITPPIASDHAVVLERLLAPARRLGFQLPAEGAVHLHFDARRLASAPVMRRLIHYFHQEREALRQRFQPNPRCRRLGPWSDALLAAVDAEGFEELSWDEARRALAATGLTKFCDFNLCNIVDMDREKFTFEVRILPPGTDSAVIAEAAEFFAERLHRIVSGD